MEMGRGLNGVPGTMITRPGWAPASYGLGAIPRGKRRSYGMEMGNKFKRDAKRKANAVWATMGKMQAQGVVFSAMELDRIATGTLKVTDIKKIKQAHRNRRR